MDYEVTPIAQHLFVPWSIIFTSPQRMIVSERNGNLRVINNNVLEQKSLAVFEVSQKNEEGLMGLAVDPNYSQNQKIYACLAYENNDSLYNKIISFTDEGSNIANIQILIDNIPAARYHAGCRLLFLPDKTLLITTGDATNKDLAQNLDSMAGKILRLNRDGGIPTDNPFPSSPIFTYGHRNSQGLAFDTNHNMLWASEHGPSLFDGPAGGDEINLIEAGKNYGWPIIHHRETEDGLISPELEFTPAIAPAALLYYSGDLFPQFKNKLLLATLKGESIYQLDIDPLDPRKLSGFKRLSDINIGRIREIVQGPDGAIYIATSNRDGRGTIQPTDDTIYKLSPKK